MWQKGTGHPSRSTLLGSAKTDGGKSLNLVVGERVAWSESLLGVGELDALLKYGASRLLRKSLDDSRRG